MDNITLKIDGELIEVPRGSTLLSAARLAGKDIPTFCHHEELKPFGSCFICVVELEGRPNLVPSCSTPADEGMVVYTASERVTASRKTCIELLLSDHVGDCLGPCTTSCPAGIDIPGFINHIAQGRDREALKLIKEAMPLPGILGRVCTRPCEAECRRQKVDDPIAICQLKRYPADAVAASGGETIPACAPPSGKQIAVVGAGPAGLSAAYFLQMAGHTCTVYDAHPAPGGMVRYGIPAYRLPRDVIDREVAVIEQMGASFQYGKRMGKDFTLDELSDAVDAVFLGLGAQVPTSMRVEGEDTRGVQSGVAFLHDVSAGVLSSLSGTVLVVGGGNTAIDAARTSIRLGAREVTILYRRTRNEMPAWDEEVDAAEEEGVKLRMLSAPLKISPSAAGLHVTCMAMELGPPDDSGRRRPVPLEGSEFEIVVDHVIAAIGQRVDAQCTGALKLTRWGAVETDAHTMQTSIEGVFAGGDCVSGADIAVQAVAAGRRAAVAIDQYVKGLPVMGGDTYYHHTMGSLQAISEAVYEGYDIQPRVQMPHLETEKRRRTFGEVEKGFTVEMARKEAGRCMECGCRDAHECKLRDYAADCGAEQQRYVGEQRTFKRDETHRHIVYEESKCIQCGTCVRITDQLSGTHALGFTGRGFASRIGPPLHKQLVDVNPEGLQKLVESCPVGALVAKDADVQSNTL